MAFCWIGDADPTLQTYLGPEIAAAESTGRFFMPGFQQDVAEWLSAADVFALTSREDPYPSVVLEALSAGLLSPVLQEMRADFNQFPPFTGGNVHYVLETRFAP